MPLLHVLKIINNQFICQDQAKGLGDTRKSQLSQHFRRKQMKSRIQVVIALAIAVATLGAPDTVSSASTLGNRLPIHAPQVGGGPACIPGVACLKK